MDQTFSPSWNSVQCPSCYCLVGVNVVVVVSTKSLAGGGKKCNRFEYCSPICNFGAVDSKDIHTFCVKHVKSASTYFKGYLCIDCSIELWLKVGKGNASMHNIVIYEMVFVIQVGRFL